MGLAAPAAARTRGDAATAAPGMVGAEHAPPAGAGPLELSGDHLALLAGAAEALAAEDPEGALELLALVLLEQPDEPMARFLLGIVYLDLERPEEALTELERAAALDPRDASTRSVLARVLHDLGRVEEAAERLREVVALEPDVARHWTSLGIVAWDAGHWDEALDAFLAAVERDPGDAAAHRGLARLYTAIGELELAATSYRTALVREGQDPTLHVALGHVLRDLGRPREAARAYGRAGELDPDNGWIEANVASAWLEAGDPLAARRAFERALLRLDEPSPALAWVHLNHGQALQRLGDLDGAELCYGEALALQAGMAPAHEALGALLLDLDRGAEAREHLARALELEALPAPLLVELVVLHEEAGDWEEARACAGALLAEEGGPALAFRQAQLRLRARQPALHDAAAAEALLRPLVAGPLADHPASWLLLAEALVEQGEMSQAVEALDGALAGARPDDPAWSGVQRRHDLLVGQRADR